MPLTDLQAILRTLHPVLNDGTWVFAVAGEDADLGAMRPVAVFREREGTTVVVEERRAAALGLVPRFRAAWITLGVDSDLEAVGLTAAFASALAQAGISCNVVAAVHHDHLFVPAGQGERALDVLRALQARGG